MDGQTGHRTGTGEHGQGGQGQADTDRGYGRDEHGQGYTDGHGPVDKELYLEIKVFY